jgi:hypothetical protein
MPYVPYPLVVDPDAIVTQTVLDLAAQVGIDVSEINEGDPAFALAEVLALRTAESRILTVDFAEYAFRQYARLILGVTQTAAAAATMPTTWTLADDLGHTIPAGTRVAWRTASGGALVAFEVVDAVAVDAGDTEAEIVLSAVVEGVAGNGHGPGALTLIDPLSYVTTVVSDAASSGGVDAETGPEYSDRVAEEATLLSLTPILEDDFEVLARRVDGVHRARATARYDFATLTADVGGHVTVAVVDEDGATVAAEVKTAVETLLEDAAARITNFVVHVVDPVATVVTVDFDAIALDGYDPVTVEAAAIAALENLLDPAVWGGGDEDPPAWRTNATVRHETLLHTLLDTPGIDRYADVTLTLNGGTADVALNAIRGLPDPTVTGDVT